jgi:rhodanese-related sulfurtransferase
MLSFFSRKNTNFQSVSIHTLKELQNQYPQAILLDVRTKAEFENGSIPNAINVDINQKDFLSKMTTFDKTKPCLVYCRSGMRSVKACKALHQAGFVTLYNLKGGYLAWNK